MPNYLSSADAAARLGVSRQTLYAYVSRGLLHAEAGDSHRESRYLADEVERLAGQRTRGRKPKEVAKATLSWGLPVLESAITLIEDGQMYYRGVNAVTLAQSASVETVAAHLWQCEAEAAFAGPAPRLADGVAGLLAQHRGQRAEASLLPLFTAASDDDATALWQRSPERQARGCGDLVRTLAACLLQAPPASAPIHEQCARAWGLDADGADLIRMALVLCADHELNASSFTARCIASTGASLRAGIVGGLAALTGGRHGGTTARGEALWDELDRGEEAGAALRERLARGEDLPGFGHHLYPGGDPRAIALLGRILPQRPAWRQWIDHAFALVGLRPSVDFALVAVRRHLGLPVGAAFGLFALGRSIGWLAHGLEQRGSQSVIRPRAAYTGIRPQGG
ncbi:citrate synthase family protein [Achromobacter sp. UMC71]|uniref:citrate synthase family protein n=1 Tax=Achromobacter sp. UMC71 TaxID=1862320 RepID=UPI0015FF3F02|nr:citrate synthase family protein [Achromobacter sp. UMC71]MBB1624235.1 excisionase [Achromobacter sp. UMC71]